MPGKPRIYAVFVFLMVPLLFWSCQKFYEYIAEYGKLIRKQEVSTVSMFTIIKGYTPCLRTRIVAMPSPVTTSTFFVLLCRCTKNVAAALDFSRNRRLWSGNSIVADASITSDCLRVAATCQPWRHQISIVQQPVGQSAPMAALYTDTQYPLWGTSSCAL